MKLVTLKTAPSTALLPTAGADLRAGQPVYFDLERGVVLPLYDLGKALTGLPTGTAAQNVREGDPVQIVTDTPLLDTSGQYTYFIVPEDFVIPVSEADEGWIMVNTQGEKAKGHGLVRLSTIQAIGISVETSLPNVLFLNSCTILLNEDNDFDTLIAAFKRSAQR